MTSPDPDDAPTARPFADFLRDQGKGRLHEELTEAMAALVAAVAETGKPGTLGLTIKVKPQPKMDGRMVLVEDSVSLKAPQLDRQTSMFFVDGAALRRDDPNQLSFDSLRDVSASERDEQRGRAAQ